MRNASRRRSLGILSKPDSVSSKQRAARGLLQPEFDQRGRFLRVVDFGIDGIRVPGEGKEPFGLHLLHHGLPFDVLVARVGNMAARDLARHERAIQFHAKPFAELTVIRQRAPDPRNRRLEFNSLLNSIVAIFRQPPGCRLARRDSKRQPFCCSFSRQDFPALRQGEFPACPAMPLGIAPELRRTRNARPAALVSCYPTTPAASSTGSAASGFFAGVMVITTTLIRTKNVPRIVRRPSASPPRKYPTSTATTGFTYA